MTAVIAFVALVLTATAPLCGHHMVLPGMVRAARARLNPHPWSST